MVLRLLIVLALALGISPALAADATYPPGSRIGLAPPDGTYWVAKMDDEPVAGIFPMIGPDFDGVPENWLAYLAVDDVDAGLEAAKAAGAKVMREPFDVPTVGRIAIIQAPGGATIAWITPVGDQ